MNETFEELIQELKRREDLSEKDIETLMTSTAANILEEINKVTDDDILTILYYPTKDWKVGEPTYRSIKMSSKMFPEYKGKILEFKNAPRVLEACSYQYFKYNLL